METTLGCLPAVLPRGSAPAGAAVWWVGGQPGQGLCRQPQALFALVQDISAKRDIESIGKNGVDFCLKMFCYHWESQT